MTEEREINPDYWLQLCSVERFSFILQNGGVRRVRDSTGNWVDYSEIQKIVSDAQDRIDTLENKITELYKENNIGYKKN